MDDGLSKIRAQSDQSGIPLVRNFSKSGTAAGHQDMSDPIFEFLHLVFVHSQEGLGSYFFGLIVL